MHTVPDDAVEILGVEPEPLWTFAYVSRPTVPFSEVALRQLHLVAEAHNVRDGITGRLVVVEEGEEAVRFVQCIEGPKPDVEACARRIFSDARHADIEVIQSTALRRRRFPEWSMRFERAESNRLDGDVAAALWTAEAASSRPAVDLQLDA